MKKILFCIVSVSVLFVCAVSAQAAADRDELIEQALTCASLQKSAGTLDWADVCAAKDAPKKAYQPESKFHRLFRRSNPSTKLEFGFEVFSYNYKEPDLMELEGEMVGLFTAYTYRFSQNDHIRSWRDIFSDENKINMVRWDARLSAGLLDYTSVSTGSNDDEDHYTFETRLVAGYDIPYKQDMLFTPYAGFGWRYLYDNSGGDISSTGHWAYDRESRYFYAPIGLDFYKSFNKRWNMTFNAEYDYFIDGTQKSHFEDGPTGTLDTLTNDQNDGFGWRTSLRFTRVGTKYDIFAEPFYRYWEIDNSDVQPLTGSGYVISYGREPENETTEVGLKLGIQY